MHLTFLCIIFAMILRMNLSSSQPGKYSAITDQKVEVIKKNRGACWFGRCRRRRGKGSKNSKKVSLKPLFSTFFFSRVKEAHIALTNNEKQSEPRESIAQHLSLNEWSLFRISSTDSKVRTNLAQHGKQVTGKYCFMASQSIQRSLWRQT